MKVHPEMLMKRKDWEKRVSGIMLQVSGETGLGIGDWELAMANSKFKIQEAPPKPPMPGYPQKCLKRIKRRIKSSAFNSQSTVEGARHSVQSIEEQFRPDIPSPDYCLLTFALQK